MKDYYIPKTKCGLIMALSRNTGKKASSFRWFSKSQLYSIYFREMDRKTDHVKKFYKEHSLISYV